MRVGLSITLNIIILCFITTNKIRIVLDSQHISLIKLERMGLISKSIETDHQDGYDVYAYSITELGVDELLNNEEVLQPKISKPTENFTDNVPFWYQ